MQDFIGWRVGEQTFDNKVRAMEYANWNQDRITFHYRENTLDGYNFGTEPELDWETLLIESCKQLRDSCNHLALWYSGGGDSSTIVKTCRENNILIDELVFYDRVYGVYDYWETESAFIKEQMHRYRDDHNPNCKITVLTVDYDNAINYYRRHSEDWIYQPHVNLRFSKNLRHNIIHNNPEFAKRFYQDNRIDIFGRDKPKLILWENRWYMTFLDSFEYDTYISGHHHFYWDNLDILCKQAHMAVRFFENLPDFNESRIHEIQGNEPGEIYTDYCRAIGRDIPNDKWIAQGLNKKTNDPRNKNYESQRLLEQAQTQDPDIYNMYTATHKYLDENFTYESSKEFLGTTLGKTYYLKDFMQ